MTYNVHSCVGIDGRCSLERIADVISAERPDVVCLQEVDVRCPRTGSIDQAQALADALTMNVHFSALRDDSAGLYGDAILTRMPFELIRAAPFPSVPRAWPKEERGAIWIELSQPSARWQIINTHLGLGREERRLQASYLTKDWITPAFERGPVILCGDLNSRPTSQIHRVLGEKMVDAFTITRAGHPRTFSTRFPFVCLDYVYVSERRFVRSIQRCTSRLGRIASDHFPVFAELSPG